MSLQGLMHYAAVARAGLLIIILCCYPVVARAAPREATIFPESAQIREVSKVSLMPESEDLVKAVIILPGQADPHSLVMTLPPESRLKIEDLQHRQAVRQDDLKIRDLRGQIENLREERNSLQAGLHSVENQLQFWQLQIKAKVKTLQEGGTAVALIGKNIKKAYQEKLSRQGELERVDKKLKALQDEAKRAADAKEAVWEFTLFLSGQRTGEAILTYTYLMSGCGWTPLYRMDAQPGAKRILFSTQARIWQNSGQDWNGVDISLSTVTPPTHTVKAEPSKWIIKPLTDKKSGVAPNIWKAGRRNLPSGYRQLVKLKEDYWPSEFVHLLKPAAATQAIISASINPPQAEGIIPGKAILTIDGNLSQVGDYSLTGRQTVVHFGPDPLVRATRGLAAEKVMDTTAQEGRKIVLWTRRIDVSNSRTSPARLQIEEPCPRPGDDRISLTLKNDPETTTENSSTLIWTLDLEAGQKKSLVTTVTINAPEKMEIDPF